MLFTVAGGRRHSVTLKASDELTVNLLVTPGPGEVCELCREKAPTKGALEMRKWRARKKDA